MGIYLPEPIKDKDTSTGGNQILSYAASGMQGWRMHMEDAHVTLTPYGDDPMAALFAVFDGHGGNLCFLNE